MLYSNLPHGEWLLEMRYYVNKASVLVCAINTMIISFRCLNDTDLYRFIQMFMAMIQIFIFKMWQVCKYVKLIYTGYFGSLIIYIDQCRFIFALTPSKDQLFSFFSYVQFKKAGFKFTIQSVHLSEILRKSTHLLCSLLGPNHLDI